jgi:hypothetical protein
LDDEDAFEKVFTKAAEYPVNNATSSTIDPVTSRVINLVALKSLPGSTSSPPPHNLLRVLTDHPDVGATKPISSETDTKEVKKDGHDNTTGDGKDGLIDDSEDHLTEKEKEHIMINVRQLAFGIGRYLALLPLLCVSLY